MTSIKMLVAGLAAAFAVSARLKTSSALAT